MRFTQIPCPLSSLLAIILSCTHTQAKPFPRDDTLISRQNHTLELRDCPVPCGWENQYCCSAGQACVTAAGIASCAAGAVGAAVSTANGQWQMFTTTYVETDLVTVTTTYSEFISTTAYTPVVATQVVTTVAPAQTAICNPNLNEVSCGSICCAQGQFCAYANQCQAYGGSSTNGNVASTVYYTPLTTPLSSASAFIRPTSGTTETVTATGTATTTVPFQTPVGTDGSSLTGITATQTNNGLSGGAIAGIVIGVLLAIFLLFLFCACCLAKGLIDSVLGIFGLGPNARKRRVTDTTIIEERRSRHSGRVQGGGRTWFGTSGGPARPSQRQSSGWGGALGVGAALAALAVLLGLKRRRDRETKSEYGTGSSYSYSDYTSESSESSDRRTRDTRRSRR